MTTTQLPAEAFKPTTVRNIINEVRSGGDTALKTLSERFDNVKLTELKVTGKEITESALQVPDSLKKAINTASDNIRKNFTWDCTGKAMKKELEDFLNGKLH